MSRMKKHSVKKEKTETSSSRSRPPEEYDLTYYIHDRVELMHHVFSVLKHKDIKAMAPECIRNASIDNIQELCTEELLGISSKRLCAILDGAEPPSDTESSSESPDRLETISLDSISSDEEILSQTSSKKHKKHKKHKSRGAGLTVLELLELQARARAIRAQLHQEQAAKQATEPSATSPKSSDNEVEIKEEVAEVVEISSEDEKPDVKKLQETIKDQTKPAESSITKRVNDLVITVPQIKQSRKIKLNRSKITVSVNTNNTSPDPTTSRPKNDNIEKAKNSKETKAKEKKKQKKKDKKKKDRDSDHDEITLQLSDTEKMDLLEDLDRKNYEKLSSGTEDSESSSSDTEAGTDSDSKMSRDKKKNIENSVKGKEIANENDERKFIHVIDESSKDNTNEKIGVAEETESQVRDTNVSNTKENVEEEISDESQVSKEATKADDNSDAASQNDDDKTENEHSQDGDTTQREIEPNVEDNISDSQESCVDITSINDIPIKDDKGIEESINKEEPSVADGSRNEDGEISEGEDNDIQPSKKESVKELTEREKSDKDSSEVEEVELKPEIVCVSDEETDKRAKKKKKKEKKNKQKKSKKSKSDFRVGDDQNFYKDSENTQEVEKKIENNVAINKHDSVMLSDDDSGDVYEILELSDDSSCYEVEGTILSKEPTTEEIEALSAKIDEIEREDIVTDKEIEDHEKRITEDNEEVNISWKDRYLGSKKVKRVLTTANILNALRKKNRELQRKMEEAKKKEKEEEPVNTEVENVQCTEEGTIDQYNTLQGSTKYVDPV